MVMFAAGWADPNDTKVQTARFYFRSNADPDTASFNMGNIFFPYIEVLISNAQIPVLLPIPVKFVAKSDTKVSALAYTAGAGPGDMMWEGYLVT